MELGDDLVVNKFLYALSPIIDITPYKKDITNSMIIIPPVNISILKTKNSEYDALLA